MYTPVTPFLLPLLVAAQVSGIVAYLAFAAWRRRRVPGAIAFAVMMLGVAEWALAYGVQLEGQTFATKLLGARLKYVGTSVIPLAWLAFSLQYGGRSPRLVHRLVGGLAPIPAVTVILAWTHGAHQLLWREIVVRSDALGPMLEMTHGPWLWVHTTAAYLELGAGTAILVATLSHAPARYRVQPAVLLAAVVAPWLANVVYVAGLSPVRGLDPTPFAFTLTGIVLVWGMFRARLLDVFLGLLPVARNVLVEGMRDGVMVFDERDRLVELNPAAERFLGRPAAMLMGRRAAEIFGDGPATLPPVGTALDWHAEIRLVAGDGARDLDLLISPLSSRRHDLVGRLVVMRDITDHKRSLREAQALLTVAESVSGTLELVEVMRRVSREATRLVGADTAAFYTFDEATERVMPMAGYHVPPRFQPLVRSYGRDEMPHLVETFFAGKALFVRDAQSDAAIDSELITAAGVRSFLMSPVRHKDQTYGCLVLFWLTDRPEATAEELALVTAVSSQAALALANARLFAGTEAHAAALREKNAELDSFVYSVSHDLKAPLVSIQGMSSLLRAQYGGALGEDGGHFLARIEANVEQMERLISDLLALSRVGREGRASELVDVPSLVDEVLAGLGGPLRAAGVSVVRRDAGTVWGVRVQLEQVLVNLLSNAVKYLGDAATSVIEVGTHDRGDALECYVRDSGIGIPPAYHEKIFEIFQRLDDVHVEGTGIGLAIVKKIVDAAGGRVWVESAAGRGATFRFTWPKAPHENGR